MPFHHKWPQGRSPAVLLTLSVLQGKVTRYRLISCCCSPSLRLNYYRSSSRHCQRARESENTAHYHANPPATEKHTHIHRVASAHTNTITDGTLYRRWGSNRRMIMVIYVWKSECHWRHSHSSKLVKKPREQGMDRVCAFHRYETSVWSVEVTGMLGLRHARSWCQPRITYPSSMWLTLLPFVSTLFCLAAVPLGDWWKELRGSSNKGSCCIEVFVHETGEQHICSRWNAVFISLQSLLVIQAVRASISSLPPCGIYTPYINVSLK